MPRCVEGRDLNRGGVGARRGSAASLANGVDLDIVWSVVCGPPAPG
jgi:hypothetical protein